MQFAVIDFLNVTSNEEYLCTDKYLYHTWKQAITSGGDDDDESLFVFPTKADDKCYTWAPN